MQITFDTDSFVREGRKAQHEGVKSLTNVLYYLKKYGCISAYSDRSIERATCKTPSDALRYCRYLASGGISREAEAVFLKNPKIGVAYLRRVGRSQFIDPEVHKKFRRKFRSDARLAYMWASAFNIRLTEEEEQVFRKDMSAAKDYAVEVIRGGFSEKVHKMLLLASFGKMTEHHKKCLSEYIKFAERTGNKSNQAV